MCPSTQGVVISSPGPSALATALLRQAVCPRGHPGSLLPVTGLSPGPRARHKTPEDPLLLAPAGFLCPAVPLVTDGTILLTPSSLPPFPRVRGSSLHCPQVCLARRLGSPAAADWWGGVPGCAAVCPFLHLTSMARQGCGSTHMQCLRGTASDI